MKTDQNIFLRPRRRLKAAVLPGLALILLASDFSPPLPSAEASGIRRSIRRKVVKKVTPKASLPPITTDPSGSDILISHSAQEQCRATVFPSFINHSMGWSESSARHYGQKSIKIPLLGKVDHETPVYKGFRSVSPPSIHVVAAGNEHPTPLSEIKTSMSKNLGAIVVGAIGPDGRRSPYSSQGEEVHIMAPSSSPGMTNLTSANDDGRFRAFGGTSGATPLVTGSLAGFEWLAGYHPTAKEAKTLLAKTAIVTRYSGSKPRKNGIGMVNAYKLAMVGKRLKAQCGRDLDCFRRKIKDAETYKFPEDPGLAEALGQAFPQCSRDRCAQSNVNNPPSCAGKDAALKRLRKAAFLNPSNRKHWRQIACIYSEGGFHKNSGGALSIYKNLSGPYGKSQTHCKSDKDCVLAPDCPASRLMGGVSMRKTPRRAAKSMQKGGVKAHQLKRSGFIPMNLIAAEEHYIRCMGVKGGAVLCNGKCRCGREERFSSSGGGSLIYQSQCVKSRCVMNTSKMGAPAGDYSPQPAPSGAAGPAPAKSPPAGGSSGRR